MAALSVIRSQILAALGYDSAWRVHDEVVDGDVVYPPCVVLRSSIGVRHDAFGSRLYTFTASLTVDPATARNDYDRLLDALGTGGYIDQLETVLAEWPNAPWSTARPSSSAAVAVEQFGQLLAQTAELTVEVWE